MRVILLNDSFPPGGDANLDSIAIQSLLYSACLITSTIHCADFPDIDGDHAQGRTTLPILFPKASRTAFFVAIAAWSWYLVRAWALGICCASAFIGFGLYIGSRVLRYVDQKADKRSYLLYNVRDFNG
jgi:1,4-dihydroxy-2-naphthoate octaprenyltransferase